MESPKTTLQRELFHKGHCKNINTKYSDQPQRNDEIQNTVLDVEYIYFEPTQSTAQSTSQNHTNQR